MDAIFGYRVDGPLATGGMGVLLHGRRVADNRDVVLKAPRVDRNQARERFTREARALASLDHPGVVKLLDIECSKGGTPLLILERVSGSTLGQVLDRGQLKRGTFEQVARGLAEALDHCHKRGVVHRDVKPDNIMVGPDGAVTLIDFGLSFSDWRKPPPPHRRLTPSFANLGTPPFAAPEQFRTEHNSEPSADAYAFGKVLDACLQRVEWDGRLRQRKRWQSVAKACTREEPGRRPLPGELLGNWPRHSLSAITSAPRRALWPWTTAAAALGLGLGALASLPLMTAPPQQERLSGWLGDDGLGSVSLSLDQGKILSVRGIGGTNVRLLGTGSWTEGPLRIEGNGTGLIRLRLQDPDGIWDLELSR
jgi:serine/threonine-protein kinase